MTRFCNGVIFASLISFALLVQCTQSITQPGGVLADEAPEQTTTTDSPFELNGYTLTPLADFSLRGRVLSHKRYSHDRESDLSPVDLALGWGAMSDSNTLANFSITQSNRWYHWRSDDMPISKGQVTRESANMHMIPADSVIESDLFSARVGHIVAIRGYLVRVDAADGWHWVSSLKRGDSGDGACELVYVTALQVTE